MLSAPPNRIENLPRDVDKRCGFTLKASNTALISYHHQSTLGGVSGSGTVSSSDGQRFGIQKHSLLASFYPRYFGYYDRAVSVYTHISDQLSAFSTRVISCARAALYVLDGLLENDSVLRLREHSTDTHGYIEDLFGLCYLLAIRSCRAFGTWQISNFTGLIATRCTLTWQGSSGAESMSGDYEQGELFELGIERHLGMEHAPDCQNRRDSPANGHAHCR